MNIRTILASLWISLAAATLGARPAEASRIKIRFEDESADRMISLLARGYATDEAIDAVVETPGCRLLLDRLTSIGSSPGDRGDTERRFRVAMEGAVRGRSEVEAEFGLGGVASRGELARGALSELRRVSGSLEVRLAERLNGLLPPRSGFEARVHVVVGGGQGVGVAFADGDDVVIRLDAFLRRTPRHPVDVDRFAAVLADELWQVGYRSAGGPPPRPSEPSDGWSVLAAEWGPALVGEIRRASVAAGTGEPGWDAPALDARLDAWVPPRRWSPRAVDRLLVHLARLQREGTAAWVAAPMGNGAEIARWMEGIDHDFAQLAALVEAMARGATPGDLDALAVPGFRDHGPFTRVGFRMAERIDRQAGRRPFLSATSGGPLEFVETYLQTHPGGAGQIDPDTEEHLRRLIREIRAVGAFVPDP